MAPGSTVIRSPRHVIPARLRPLVVAIVGVILAGGSVSPAIALSPSAALGSAATAAALATVTRIVPALAEAASVSGRATGAAASASSASRAPTASTVRVGTPAEAMHPRPAGGKATTASPKTADATSFSGRNHLWIPALGIDRSTLVFPCSRQQAPADYVYRWGCAGTNNVYLMGHAYGVFKALHDAYDNGRLKVGLTAIYADASGTLHTYRVAWWRVVRPTTDAKWAWASLATPSMTLQTCLGANSEYRLMVRLVQVG